MGVALTAAYMPFIRPAGTQPTCRMAVNMILTANEEAAKREWLAKNTRGPPSSRYGGEQVESYAYGRPGSESAADRRARRDALDIEAAQTFQSAARIVNPPPPVVGGLQNGNVVPTSVPDRLVKRKGGRQIRGEAAQPPPQQQFTPPPQQQATPPPQGFGQQQAPPPQAFGQQAPPQNQAPPTNSFAPPVDMVVPNLGMSRAAPNFGQQAPPHGDPSMDQPPPQTRTPETPPVSDYAMARGAPPFGAPPGAQAAAKWPNANHAEMAAKRLPLWKLQASSSPTTATKPKGDSITYQNNVAPPPATNPLSKLGLPTQPVDEAVLRAEWEAQEAAKRIRAASSNEAGLYAAYQAEEVAKKAAFDEEVAASKAAFEAAAMAPQTMQAPQTPPPYNADAPQPGDRPWVAPSPPLPRREGMNARRHERDVFFKSVGENGGPEILNTEETAAKVKMWLDKLNELETPSWGLQAFSDVAATAANAAGKAKDAVTGMADALAGPDVPGQPVALDDRLQAFKNQLKTQTVFNTQSQPPMDPPPTTTSVEVEGVVTPTGGSGGGGNFGGGGGNFDDARVDAPMKFNAKEIFDKEAPEWLKTSREFLVPASAAFVVASVVSSATAPKAAEEGAPAVAPTGATNESPVVKGGSLRAAKEAAKANGGLKQSGVGDLLPSLGLPNPFAAKPQDPFAKFDMPPPSAKPAATVATEPTLVAPPGVALPTGVGTAWEAEATAAAQAAAEAKAAAEVADSAAAAENAAVAKAAEVKALADQQAAAAKAAEERAAAEAAAANKAAADANTAKKRAAAQAKRAEAKLAAATAAEEKAEAAAARMVADKGSAEAAKAAAAAEAVESQAAERAAQARAAEERANAALSAFELADAY